MIRIAITGPESSGKTTLSEQLATHFEASLVREYARDYLTSLDRPYTQEDVIHIAQQQLLLEKKAAESNPKLIICDTDVLVLKIWFMHKYKGVPEWLEKAIVPNRYALYLLLKPDIPYESDPLRENPEKGWYFFNQFQEELDQYDFPYVIISGDQDTRFNASKKAINNIANGPFTE